jgi:methylenetetrahydrofolate reductase (NADPH)
MRIRDIIKQQQKSLSFEFFVPKSEKGENSLVENMRRLEALKPTFVSVTQSAMGNSPKNSRRLVTRIREETSLEPMPHLICVDQSKGELRDTLEGYNAVGIENILALRGDPPQGRTEFRPAEDGFRHAKDMVELVASLKSFSIGVAAYPEGHIEAPSLEADMIRFKEKVDAGADFAITQMFFQNRFFYDFIERAQRAGIDIPIIPGIMPIMDIEKVKMFSQSCGATLPGALLEGMEKVVDSTEDARKVGMEFTIQQCDDLLENGVRYFHFFTLNRVALIMEILENLDLKILQQ